MLGLWIEEFSFLAAYAFRSIPEGCLKWACLTLLSIWVKKRIEITLYTASGLFVPVRQVFTSYTHWIRRKIRLIFGTQAFHILLIKSSSTWTRETFLFGHIKIRVIRTDNALLSTPNWVINWAVLTWSRRVIEELIFITGNTLVGLFGPKVWTYAQWALSVNVVRQTVWAFAF